jgi:hypothetical protein
MLNNTKLLTKPPFKPLPTNGIDIDRDRDRAKGPKPVNGNGNSQARYNQDRSNQDRAPRPAYYTRYRRFNRAHYSEDDYFDLNPDDHRQYKDQLYGQEYLATEIILDSTEQPQVSC